MIIAIFILAFGSQVAWAASTDDKQTGTDFCGVKIKFSDKPKIVPDKELKWVSDLLGPYDKYNISGQINIGYKLMEMAICICREDEISSMVIFNGIAPAENASHYAKRNIPNIGPSESWQTNDESTKTKSTHQFTRISFQPLCAILQGVSTPENSNDGLNFINSLGEIKSSENSLPVTTARERLLQLESLKKDGLITQSEYEVKKKNILDSL
jgi:hypothetical protein